MAGAHREDHQNFRNQQFGELAGSEKQFIRLEDKDQHAERNDAMFYRKLIQPKNFRF